MNIFKYKYWFLIFSACVLIPGIISLAVFGLRLSVDFSGGSMMKYQFKTTVDEKVLLGVLTKAGVAVDTVSVSGTEAVVRSKTVDTTQIDAIKTAVFAKFPGGTLSSFETVGPVIGQETTKNAFVALIWASVGILLFIAYAFRNIPKPYSSFRFGISAIIAMLHDAFVVLGIFSILGHFSKIEVDPLFITAMLTVIGFSVHDTIVVFDRIRENLNKLPRAMGFEEVVNFSVVETMNRSVTTSFTVFLTLLSLYLLGGESIKTFVLAMLIGIVSGTYSSIFNASPILVIWENWTSKRKK